MQNRKELLEKLAKLLVQKKSKDFYAKILKTNVNEVEDLLSELRGNYFKEDKIIKEDFVKGTITSSIVIDYEPKSHEELAKLHKIDLTKYKITSYWSKQRGTKFTSSVLATLIKEDSQENFQKEFKEFLKVFKPSDKIIPVQTNVNKSNIALILPKQDAHYNKLDIYGDNNIEQRFNNIKQHTINILKKASAVDNIKEIVYIVGSDQFNSEWTGLTTKGTVQSNILSYQEAFKAICDHEIDIIETLLSYSKKVKVLFIPGNHDEFVGWHLVDWLEAFFRKNNRIEFNSSIENTKYYRYNNTAIMFNHGDVMKPKDLAHRFPIGFKKEWSLCDNFAILTGDRHHELTVDVHGIRFYQVPQLSKAVSKWDDKMGFNVEKAEMQAFTISEKNGITTIYKEPL